MGRNLCFELDGQQHQAHQAGIEKVDRKKVYGWVGKKAVDTDGANCSLRGNGAGSFFLEFFSRIKLLVHNELAYPCQKIATFFKKP